MRRALAAVLGAVIFIGSAVLVFLCLADACEPEEMYINATWTGNLLCPFCVLTFAGAVLYIGYRLGADPCDAAQGGIATAILPHAVIILSLLFEVLTVTNFFNHAMDLLTSDLSKSMLIIYAVLSLSLSALLSECAWRTK